jgi:hypothetical protein
MHHLLSTVLMWFNDSLHQKFIYKYGSTYFHKLNLNLTHKFFNLRVSTWKLLTFLELGNCMSDFFKKSTFENYATYQVETTIFKT